MSLLCRIFQHKIEVQEKDARYKSIERRGSIRVCDNYPASLGSTRSKQFRHLSLSLSYRKPIKPNKKNERELENKKAATFTSNWESMTEVRAAGLFADVTSPSLLRRHRLSAIVSTLKSFQRASEFPRPGLIL